MSIRFSWWVFLCAGPLASCDSGGGGGPDAIDEADAADGSEAIDGESDGDAGDGDVGDAEDVDDFTPVCNAGVRWVAGTSAFREATEEWGLFGIVGTRLSVADIDGDGWADVAVRNGAGPDDFAEGGARARWILRNVGGRRFEDVTHASGVLRGRVDPDPDHGRPGQIFTSGDVDNDGDLDVFVGNSRTRYTDATIETSDVMLNQGDGTFVIGPEGSDARFSGVASNPAVGAFVDFDRDGNLDLWVVHNETSGPTALQDRLLRGDGAGGFTDVTAERGLGTSGWASVAALNEARCHSWGWSGAACDLNDDGLPELLASSYGRAPNHLWRATIGTGGIVEYVNESVASGYAFDHRTDWTDNVSARCHCADNPTDAECDTVPPPDSYAVCEAFWAAFGGTYRWNHATGREPFQLGGNSGATMCADIDNDGRIDLLTSEIVHWDVGSSSDPAEILVNLGDPNVRFDRPGNEVTGLVRVDRSDTWDHGDMTGAVFDFDNDAWPDVYIGASDYPDNKGLLFHQTAPLEFERLEVGDYFLHYRSHGVVTADFDRDGDLDVLVGHSRSRCDGYPRSFECNPTQQVQLFENLMGEGSNWIQMRLEGGPGSNRAAIGARVEVTAGGTTQTQEVDGGHGHFCTQRDLVLHFGLGAACEADVRVRWPDASGSVQVFSVPGNVRYRVVQGSDPIRER